MVIKLTDEQRGEIRKRANLATPGFWNFWDCNQVVPGEDNNGRFGVQDLIAVPHPFEYYAEGVTIPTTNILEALFDHEVEELDKKHGGDSPVSGGIVRVLNPADLPFIANARQDIPALLDTCDALQSEVEGLTIDLDIANEAIAEQKQRIEALTNRLFAERLDTLNLATETMNALCAALVELLDKDGIPLPERIRKNAAKITTSIQQLIGEREEWDTKNLPPVWSAERITQAQEETDR